MLQMILPGKALQTVHGRVSSPPAGGKLSDWRAAFMLPVGQRSQADTEPGGNRSGESFREAVFLRQASAGLGVGGSGFGDAGIALRRESPLRWQGPVVKRRTGWVPPPVWAIQMSRP